jgi:hypothetical protein
MSPSLLGQLCILTAATSSNHAVYWKFFVLEYVESLNRNFRSKFSLMQVNNLQSNWYITIRLCDAKACIIHAKLSRSSMVLCSHCKCNVWSTNSCGKYRFTPSYYYYFIIFFFFSSCSSMFDLPLFNTIFVLLLFMLLMVNVNRSFNIFFLILFRLQKVMKPAMATCTK